MRGKLWKGEAPGLEDPYTQRAEPPDASNLPEEALQLPRADRTPAAIRASRLVLPPKRTEAASEKEAKSSDPTYIPATDGESLEQISSLDAWWEQDGHWGPESEFKPFGSSDKVADRHVVEVYLRQAVVEALSLQQAGLFSEWASKRWRGGSTRSDLDQVLAVEVQVQDGQATLKGDSSRISQGLLAEVDEVEPGERVTADEAAEMVKAWDASWKDLVLDDQMKFTLRKRLYQLTGTLIPDAKLGAARTIRHVLTLAAKQPKPQRLAELLERRSDVQRLGNLKVHRAKIGPVEKETALGRWKVIEAELAKRNLPVTGTAGLSKSKERDWIMGRA